MIFRDTILARLDCDLKSLPLGAIEVFVLSQIDGTLTLEELAEVTGLELSVATRLARKLVDLGAAHAIERRAPRRTSTPKSQRATAIRTKTVPPAPKSARPPSPRKSSAKMVAEEASDLDEATREQIAAMEANLASLDHYALLGVERDCDKKAIKRAYAALAGKFHPDRFYGKKLGSARTSLARVFQGVTAAHDVLIDRDKRAAYDATLPPMTPRSIEPAPVTPPPKAPTPIPAPLAEAKPPPPLRKPSRGRLMRALVSSKPAPPAPPPPAPVSSPPDEALKRFFAKGKQDEKQRRVEVFVRAAEDALARDDVLTAANNFRLALQNGENPALRRQLEAIEERAKTKQHTVSLSRAKAAEREGRWDEAASCYARAHATQPTAELAERTAHALCKSAGDLHQAAKLAEQAVAEHPNNASYHATLGEIYLAAQLWTRAARVASRALELAPHDARAKALAAAARSHKG